MQSPLEPTMKANSAFNTLISFMTEFFRARTMLYSAAVDGYDKFQLNYFCSNYAPYNIRKSVLNSSAEQVLEIIPKGCNAQVITSGGMGFGKRSRYSVLNEDEHWKILSIEFECDNCHGSGKLDNYEECPACRSKGWILMRNVA
jgi:hypothetical protein